MFDAAFLIYCKKLNSDILLLAYATKHKIFAELGSIRYVYIEELKAEKMDADLFKDLVDLPLLAI